MAYSVEIIALGKDEYGLINPVIEKLNTIQSEFIFHIPPHRLQTKGYSYLLQHYKTQEIFEWLRKYRAEAKGKREFLIAVIPSLLSSDRLSNLFGSHEAEEGLAIISLHKILNFVSSSEAFLSYYLVRYSLSFVNPTRKNHDDTRGCYFDRKLNKADIKLSLLSNGNLCDDCTRHFEKYINPEISSSFKKMAQLVTALEKNDQQVIETLLPKPVSSSDLKPSKKIILPWFAIALICGFVSLLLYKLLEIYPKLIDEAAIFITISIVVLLLNPKRRFYKAFWVSMTLLSSLVLVPAFNLTGKIDTINLAGLEGFLFNLVVKDPPWIIYLVLGSIAVVSLLFDYLERREK